MWKAVDNRLADKSSIFQCLDYPITNSSRIFGINQQSFNMPQGNPNIWNKLDTPIFFFLINISIFGIIEMHITKLSLLHSMDNLDDLIPLAMGANDKKFLWLITPMSSGVVDLSSNNWQASLVPKRSYTIMQCESLSDAGALWTPFFLFIKKVKCKVLKPYQLNLKKYTGKKW